MCEVTNGSDGEEGSGASLQLAAHETFDQAWGSMARPGEPGLRRHVCPELDFRLAEGKNHSAFSLFVGLSLVLGGKIYLCHQGSVVPCSSQSTAGRHIVSLEIGLSPQMSLCTLAKGQ